MSCHLTLYAYARFTSYRWSYFSLAISIMNDSNVENKSFIIICLMSSLNLITKLDLPMTIYNYMERIFCSRVHVTLVD